MTTSELPFLVPGIPLHYMLHPYVPTAKGGTTMPGRLHLEFELPDEVAAQLREEEMALKAKEALVMELLREHHVSQGKAAEILGIDASTLYRKRKRYGL